jgi:hypothetical protein
MYKVVWYISIPYHIYTKGEIHVKENEKAIESDSQKKYDDLVYFEAALRLMPQINKMHSNIDRIITNNMKNMNKLALKMLSSDINLAGVLRG